MADKKGTKKYNNRNNNNDDDSMPRQRKIKKKVCMFCADKALVIDYKETDTINKTTLNTYLEKSGQEIIEKIPNEIITFTCTGFLCDENNKIYKLNGYGANEGLDYGRRSYEVDREALKEVMLSASYWLGDEVEENGKFIYGY